MKTFLGSDLDDMSEDLVVSIFDENNDIEQESLLLGKVGAFGSERLNKSLWIKDYFVKIPFNNRRFFSQAEPLSWYFIKVNGLEKN